MAYTKIGLVDMTVNYKTIAVSALLLFLVGFALGRNTGKANPALLARIDTVLVAGPAVHDTITRYRREEHAHADTAAQLVAQLEATRAQLALARMARDTALALTHDTGAAYAACQVENDALAARDLRWRDANRQCAVAVGKADSALTVAEGRLNLVESSLHDAWAALKHARERPKWAVGAVTTERLKLVGGALSRDVGPLMLQGMLTRETVADSLGRRRVETRGYLVGSLRF